MEKKEKSKLDIAKKVLKIMMKILYQMLIFVCVILIIIIVMQRITDSNQSFKGYRLFRIISGSMIPKFNVGEVVICKETPYDKIKVGEAIVYRGKIGELKNKLVMHEVVAVNHDEETGDLEFYAKGINNNEEDPKVTTNQILGVVKFKSKSLTVLYSLATSIYSSFVIVTVLVINVFVSFKTPREPRKPKQLAQSETNQNVNVKIENTEISNINNFDKKDNELEEDSKKEILKSENENIEVTNNEILSKNEDSNVKEKKDSNENDKFILEDKKIKKETKQLSKEENIEDIKKDKKTKNKKSKKDN